MNLLQNKLTAMSARNVLAVFREAYLAVIGSNPTNSTLAILVAQSALECGRWVSMHCYNFGNIRPPKDWNGYYCQFRCNEKKAGKWVWYDPPSPGSNFVAFEDASAGARFYIKMLAIRWPEAWNAAVAGDTQGFVHGLKIRGYFTADEKPYLSAVQGLCKEYFAYISQTQDPEPHTIAADVHASRSNNVVIAPALLEGARGPSVGIWQAIVGAVVDDDYGPATTAATKAWQKKKALPETGYVTEFDLEAAGLATHDTEPAPPPVDP